MTKRFKTPLAAFALASLTLASACSDVGEEEETATATRDDSTQTLAAALGSEEDLATLNQAVSESEIAGVLDGPASYTLLAPDDDAFAALGEEGSRLMQEEQRPVLIGILRNHLLPGHLTPEAIGEALDQQGGPVTMTTLGDGAVTFSREGDTIYVSAGDDGTRAAITGTSIAANNGVVIPLDAVLLPPKEG